MEVRRVKNSALVVFLTIAVLNGFFSRTEGAYTMGDELDNFLFGPACKRESFLTIRKACERIAPICQTYKTNNRIVPKTSYTWCQDFSDTATGSAEIAIRTTSTNNGFCPFSLVIEEGKSVTIKCTGDIVNKPLQKSDPFARIEAHYLDGTYATLAKDIPITRSSTVILVSRFSNAFEHELRCSWTVA